MADFIDADRGTEMMTKLFGRELAEQLSASFKENAETERDQWEEDVRAFTFGNVFWRPGLDLKTRALISLAVNAALGNLDIVEAWLRASRNLGIPRESVRESLIQISLYSGFPNHRRAMALMQEVFASEP